ncbi:MAG: hypothetical protein J1G01_06905 [Clostridiales bacterium]|nr:hypothetical protein [Clostridiales bacterium]
MSNHTNKGERAKIKKNRRIFILIAAIFTAIAVAVSFAFGFDNAKPITVDEVGSSATTSGTAYTNLTGDKTSPGALVSGDTITYSSGTIYSIKLPKGTFKFEVWGAQGGYYNIDHADGGKGGYTYITTYEVPAGGQTIYICVGAQGASGTSGTKAGGYNGGGSTSPANGGGGGGGATHMALVSGLLSALSSSTNQNNVLLVAGGGGGSTTKDHSGTAGVGGAGGGGNNVSGGASTGGYIDGTGYQASGGTHSSGGAGGRGSNASACTPTTGASGTFGKGGDSTSTYEAGGGGGGGWYGGGGGGGDDNSSGADGRTAGGGGSSHIKSGYSGGGSSGAKEGDGQAKITVINVNQNPVTKNPVASFTAPARGVSGSVAISATAVATDPDGDTGLYFSNGTTSDLDALNTANNQSVYINSTCSTLANNYFDWTWNSNKQTFTITASKRYPRSGIDGSTANGTITLYARVRDSHGSTSTRGWAIVSFKVTVPANTATTVTKTVTAGTGNYFVGNSNTTTAPAQNATASTIYNPSGSGRYTVIAEKPLKKGNSFTITAANLVGGNYSTTYDQPIIALNSTTAIASSNTSRKFHITEFDNNTSKITAYNTSKSAIANTFTQLTFVCDSPDSTYQVFSVTLYVVEKTTAYGSATPNTIANTSTSGIALDVVFKVDNTRPTLGTAGVQSIGVGETKALRLSSLFLDADGISTSSSHTITKVVIPTKEFIQVDKFGNVVSTNAGSYNIGSVVTGDTTDATKNSGQGNTATNFNAGIAYNATAGGTDTSNEAFMRYSYANDTLTVVGLRSSFSQYTSSRASAPGHFYLLINIRDPRDTADNGIWLPVAFKVGESLSYTPVSAITAPHTGTCSSNVTGQSNVTVLPSADGARGDSFYFAPMAVNYSGSHVVGYYKNSGGSLVQTNLQPLAIDGDNFSTWNNVSGTPNVGGLAARSGKLNEFLRLSSATTPETIVKSMSSSGYVGSSDGRSAENQYIKVEYIDIYVPKTYFATATYSGGRVIVGAQASPTDGSGFKYINLQTASDNGDYYVTNGIKITLKSATMNRYMYANAAVIDCTDKTSANIEIAIRVKNTAPYATTQTSSVATFTQPRTGAGSTYSYSAGSTPTFTYRIPLGGQVIVTPYDFVSDPDMIDEMGAAGLTVAGGFTLNGLSGKYDAATGTFSTTGNGIDFNGLFNRSVYGSGAVGYIEALANLGRLIDTKATVSKVNNKGTTGTAAGVATTVPTGGVFNDKLFFGRGSAQTDAFEYNPQTYNDIAVSMENTDGFIDVQRGNKVRIDTASFGMDFILITANTRTTHASTLELTVRDRFGDTSDCVASFVVRIVLEVINTSPGVKNPDRYQELSVTPIDRANNSILTTAIFSANGNNGASGLMEDPDNDSPEFMLSRGTILANTPDLDNLYPEMTAFSEIDSQYLTDDGTAGGRSLDLYVTATIDNRFELSVTALSSTKHIGSGVYVYFFVSDGNGGTALGYVRIEVINSKPEFNTSAVDGFDDADKLWSIESTSAADINRSRYIVGSASAMEKLITGKKLTESSAEEKVEARADDIKLIATDADGLHSYVTLSPRTIGGDGNDAYVNLEIPLDESQAISKEQYAKAVPDVAIAKGFDANTAPAAVTVFKRTQTETGTIDSAELINALDVAEFWFYHNDVWKTRDDILKYLDGKALNAVPEFFDSQGRWIFADWALHLKATSGFASNVRLGINMAVRDETALGGDTAGKNTAYNSDRKLGLTAVDGELRTTVYQFISNTGIRTKDEFVSYDNYYVVEVDQNGTSDIYVPTYDGDVTSQYKATDYTYDITYTGNKLNFDGSGTSTIKTRGEGQPDNTLAGTNSGKPYDASGIESVTGAYRYPTVIEVPAYSNEAVYVPMSYFGLLDTIVSMGASDSSVVYSNNFVGYNIGNGKEYSRSNIDDFKSAIILTDGIMTWGGVGNEKLRDNPYLTIEGFDDYSFVTNSGTGYTHFGDDKPYNQPYYNNRITVPSVNNNGELIGYQGLEVNRKSFVGKGDIIYLEEQATKLQEHNFGLTFKKKDQRTGTRNLTLTIKLAKSKGAGVVQIDDINTDTRTVSVEIHIDNNKIDFSADIETDTADKQTGLKYDSVAGTYYYDIEMPTASSETFLLSRRNPETRSVETIKTNLSNYHKLPYFDADYNAEYGTENYRDYAYFLSDSVNGFNNWLLGRDAVERVSRVVDGSLVNTSSEERAIKSMLNYFGVTTAAGIENVIKKEANYQPNGGIYGNNGDYGGEGRGAEGFSSYFTISLSENGKALNIMSSRRTFINKVALEKEFGKTYTQDQVIALYKKRGLIAEYSDSHVDPAEPTRVYYPLNVLIYDNCGAGWRDASFTAIEFRVTITNATPVLKSVGDEVPGTGTVGNRDREYTLRLATGNTITVSLYDIVSDSDMFIEGSNGYYMIATRQSFNSRATGVTLETGDYLDSPFAHDDYILGNKVYNPTNYSLNSEGKYYRDGGGLSLYGDTTKDVIMWMETDIGVTSLSRDVVPTTNNLSFTVNGRTTQMIGDKSISIDEYRFKLKFYDSSQCETQTITFIIKITNRAPSVSMSARNFTMRSGDDLTVLTAYYDNFIGKGMRNSDDNGANAYKSSATKRYYDQRVASMPDYGISSGDGQNNATGSGYWIFRDIVKSKASDLIKDSTVDRESNAPINLGYLAIADDDTPWRMRISHIDYDADKLWVDEYCQLYPELNAEVENNKALPLAINIRALSAGTTTVNITVADGEGDEVVCTLYITIVSSPPVALNPENPSEYVLVTRAGMEDEPNRTNDDPTFRLFTVPYSEGDFNVQDLGVKHAKSEYRIAMTNVARDPDGNAQTAAMKLYGDGHFTVNGTSLVRSADGDFHSDFFKIHVDQDGKAFTLIATDYDAESPTGYEKLTFVIEDAGNGDYANTLKITLHIYTLYSDMINTTVAAVSDYDAYLKGSEVVKVKSYDAFYGTTIVDPSKYAFMKLQNNVGEDNTASPITDPDVSVVGQKTYTAKLYAFFDVDEQGTITALTPEKLKTMLLRDKQKKTFTLGSGNYNEYLLGGVTYDGTLVAAGSGSLARRIALGQYVDYTFTNDGVAMTLTPQASTLNDKNILLYVEAEKNMGSRLYPRTDAVLSAGSLFRLDVEDSAPVAVKDSEAPDGVNWVAEGKKGETIKIKIHDPDNPFGALFTDSDRGDKVIINFDGNYDTIMSSALVEDPDLDWKASGNKPRAFTLEVDTAENMLVITINRRIDKLVDGKYKECVSFPITLTGTDKKGLSANTVIRISIVNTDVAAKEGFYSDYDITTGIGYAFRQTSPMRYEIDAQIKYSHPLTIELDDFITDADILDENGRVIAGVDLDSYAFTMGYDSDRIYPYEYLTDQVQDVYWYDSLPNGAIDPDTRKLLARVEPIGTDKWHRTAIKISAVDTARTLEARTYLRIIDRSADTEREGGEYAGIYITLNITVMNDAPFVKPGKEVTTKIVLGSETTTPESMLFYIGDFVDDLNESDVVGDSESYSTPTYLRLYSQQYVATTKLYSSLYDTVGGSTGEEDVGFDSSALFTVTLPAQLPGSLLEARAREREALGLPAENKDSTNKYNQWFIITPIQGYYGSGAVDITVSDGDTSSQPDTLTTTFRINIEVVYDYTVKKDAWAPMEIPCCQTRTIEIDTIMPKLNDRLGIDKNVTETRASNSEFTQSQYYVLTNIEFQNSTDSDYAKFERIGTSNIWTITAGRQVTFEHIRVNVRYALASDPTVMDNTYFWLTIVANQAPKLIFSEITFVRYHRTGDLLRDLNDSNTISLEAWQLISDEDSDEIRFISAKSQVPSLVQVKLSADKRLLTITFAARGKSEITLEFTDETGTPVSKKFVAINNDLPEGSLWLRIRASFEANKLVWVIMICVAILLIIVLIVILTIIFKRKHEREELEALLVSEMEIEEQMLKLAGGPSPTDYQSYGFLPTGAEGEMPPPDMMIGAGMNDPNINNVAGLAAPPPQDGMLPPGDGNMGM